MKKHLIVVLFFVLAQFSFGQSFKAGMQLGLTGTQVTGDLLSGYNKLGMYAGIFVMRPINDVSNFQLEMSFIQKGSRLNAEPDKGIYDTYIMRLNYIEVPLIYEYKFKRNLLFEAGLSLGYLISSYEADQYGEIENQGLPDFNKIEFAGMLGLGYQINKKLKFLFRFSYSILPIRPRPDGYQPYINAGQFNDVLCTAFQYQF